MALDELKIRRSCCGRKSTPARKHLDRCGRSARSCGPITSLLQELPMQTYVRLMLLWRVHRRNSSAPIREGAFLGVPSSTSAPADGPRSRAHTSRVDHDRHPSSRHAGAAGARAYPSGDPCTVTAGAGDGLPTCLARVPLTTQSAGLPRAVVMRALRIIPARGDRVDSAEEPLPWFGGRPLLSYTDTPSPAVALSKSCVSTRDPRTSPPPSRELGSTCRSCGPRNGRPTRRRCCRCCSTRCGRWPTPASFFEAVVLLQPTSPLAGRAHRSGDRAAEIERRRLGRLGGRGARTSSTRHR